MTTEPVEPENPAAYALARHIADHPVSTVQAAFRYLNAPVTIGLHETAAVPSAPVDRAAILNEAIDRAFKYGESLSSTGDVRIAHGMAAELQRMADEAQQPETPLRAELKPWQLLGDAPDEPLPQTERLVGGRRLTRDEARQAETLPPPEGPEYTLCACGHIEPEHSDALFRHCLECGCLRYRPVAAAVPQPDGEADDGPPAPLRRSWDDCPGFPEKCPNIRPVDPDPPVHLGGIRCGCADKEA